MSTNTRLFMELYEIKILDSAWSCMRSNTRLCMELYEIKY
jgi:hypothetical protein